MYLFQILAIIASVKSGEAVQNRTREKRFLGTLYNWFDEVVSLPGRAAERVVNMVEDHVASGKLINEELPINYLSSK